MKLESLTTSSYITRYTSPDDVVAKLSANCLVGTGFTSWYRLQRKVDFERPIGRCKATTPSNKRTNKT